MSPFALLVPRRWSGEEALAAVRLLRRMIDAIWEVHGEEMIDEIDARPERWELHELDDDHDEPGPDDDLPF
jgi:hypothetical protein